MVFKVNRLELKLLCIVLFSKDLFFVCLCEGRCLVFWAWDLLEQEFQFLKTTKVRALTFRQLSVCF